MHPKTPTHQQISPTHENFYLWGLSCVERIDKTLSGCLNISQLTYFYEVLYHTKKEIKVALSR